MLYWTIMMVLVCAISESPVSSQNVNAAPQEFCASVAEIRVRNKIPGLVVAIVTKSGVESIAVDGIRQQGKSNLITANDRMHLGSCTKAFTATLCAVLVADGKLKWTSTVEELLGSDVPGMHADWKSVTLEELLRHRSGAPSAPSPEDWKEAFACTDSPKECRTVFVRSMLARAPALTRATFAYSNQGYAIAGRMIEIASGKDFESLLAERVLVPLTIQDFGFGIPTKSNTNSPSGHAEDATPRDMDNPNAIAPAGTLHMPVGEWAKFIAFHLGAEPPAALAGAASQLAHLHARGDIEPFEALGWMTANRAWGGKVLTHSGSNTLWHCVAWLSPENGFAVLAASNQGGDAAAKACDEGCAAAIREFSKHGVAATKR
jgi:CubicO group peptidase (beta-lactamase class C family)